jgi:predicted GNAT family N-acyltransferase
MQFINRVPLPDFFKETHINTTTVDVIVNLRHKVLRPGFSISEVEFKEDKLPETRHYAAHYKNKSIACLTLMNSKYAGNEAWRLRAMAVEQQYRGKGLGRELLSFTLNDLMVNNLSKTIWCYSRVTSEAFYKKFDFVTEGQNFLFGNAGESIKMVRKLKGR